MSETEVTPIKRRKKLTKTGAVDSTPTIPKDLENQWSAVQAAATAFNVLKDATHKQMNFRAVDMSLGFLAKLHEKAVEDALKHPDAALIPELKAEIDKKEGANGKAQ